MRVLGEAKQLSDYGHSVVITTYHNGRNVGGLNVERIIQIPWYTKLEAGGSWHKLYLDILLLWKSVRVAVKLKPDVIHGHLHEGALIGWLTSLFTSHGRIPVIFDVQGSLGGEMEAYGLIKQKTLLFTLFIAMEKIICKLPDRLVCSSKENKYHLVSKIKVPAAKVSVLLDGIDPDFFARESGDNLRKSLNIKKSTKVVLYTGSLLSSKGIQYLLEAIPQVLNGYQDVFFMMVGYPVKQFRAWVDNLGVGDYVHFTGKVDYFDLPAYLDMADVAVDPKLSTAGED